MKDIHHDLESIKLVAIENAKEHNCNYNVILVNPNDAGEFDLNCGSTYEFVADSYFKRPRPNVIRLNTTNNLLRKPAFAEMLDAMEEKKLTPEQETQKIIDHFSTIPAGYENLGEGHQGLTGYAGESPSVPSKIKKGLSVVHVEADGIKYKQGRCGLERIPNTNRNDLCPECKKEGIKIKFKKCKKHNE